MSRFTNPNTMKPEINTEDDFTADGVLPDEVLAADTPPEPVRKIESIDGHTVISLRDYMTIVNTDDKADMSKVLVRMDDENIEMMRLLTRVYSNTSNHVSAVVFNGYMAKLQAGLVKPGEFAGISIFYLPVDKEGDPIVSPEVKFDELAECTYQAYEFVTDLSTVTDEAMDAFENESEIDPAMLINHGVTINVANGKYSIKSIKEDIYHSETGVHMMSHVEPVVDLVFSGLHGGKIVRAAEKFDIPWNKEKYDAFMEGKLDGSKDDLAADELQAEGERMLKEVADLTSQSEK